MLTTSKLRILKLERIPTFVYFFLKNAVVSDEMNHKISFPQFYIINHFLEISVNESNKKYRRFSPNRFETKPLKSNQIKTTEKCLY